MTLESVIIFPLVALFVFVFVFASGILSGMLFHQNEVGLRFMLAVQPGSSLNGYAEERLEVRETAAFAGVLLEAQSRSVGRSLGHHFALFKGNCMTLSAIDRLLHGERP